MKKFRIRIEGQAADVEADSETSLFAAMARAGIACPVSFRNGTCRMCIARLLQGQARYEIPWPGLSAEEKIEGYCLPCVARPMAEVVKRDYVSRMDLSDAQTVVAQLPAAFEHFNKVHPHSSLRMKLPREFRRQRVEQLRRAQHEQPALHCV